MIKQTDVDGLFHTEPAKTDSPKPKTEKATDDFKVRVTLAIAANGGPKIRELKVQGKKLDTLKEAIAGGLMTVVVLPGGHGGPISGSERGAVIRTSEGQDKATECFIFEPSGMVGKEYYGPIKLAEIVMRTRG